ncbi:hypothetical protein I79_020719 [Cricetulus griseus]|uniref:Uncharacterized protein n=1 Tax=Cricetulus griseus TaxID=10029 RepID=G3IAT9_CRIGR|nr:hypothetical protein I79_020719 [Cricetulus griseus]
MVSGTREFEKKCGDSHRHLRAVRAHARALPRDRGARGKFRPRREREESYAFPVVVSRNRAVETTAFRIVGTTAFGKLGNLLANFDKEEKKNPVGTRPHL